MRLDRIYVHNFKSLVEFDLSLAPFSCLIGLNGSGKSTALQAIDFASRLFRGGISGWLSQRQWQAADLNSKLIRESNVTVTMWLSEGNTEFRWNGSFNRSTLKCTREIIVIDERPVLTVQDGRYTFHGLHGTEGAQESEVSTKIEFKYQGSILSQLKADTLPQAMRPLVSFMRETASLDALSPQQLRKRTDKSYGHVGLGGESLSAFLYELPLHQKAVLKEELKECYPQLDNVITRSLRGGWKELAIWEKFQSKWLSTEAKHINDGMLRLMAILAELLTENQFLLFDEIENGINPELVEFLLDALVKARQQVLVTTHSPMILNYLDDDIARAGVQYLYRTPEGYTRSIPFFSIPSMQKKLRIMGPGEAFADTELTRLESEIEEVGAEKKESDSEISR